MSYNDDEARQAARARLQARMERRGTPYDASNQTAERTRRASSRSDRQRTAQTSNRLPFELPFELPFPVTPVTLAAAVVVIILFIVLVVNVVRCAGGTESTSTATDEDEEALSTVAAQLSEDPPDGGVADISDDEVQALANIIGQDEADKLVATAANDPDALWIAQHPEEYAFDGAYVQAKLLKLAAREPKAVDFVRSMPDEYPMSSALSDESLAMSTESPSPDVPSTSVPHLYQWDRRWGSTEYSSTAFAITTCGPTSFAMVYQGVTGNTDLSPYDMGVLAQERGFMTPYSGTDSSFFGSMAGELGMTYEELYPTVDAITDSLNSGKVIIANLAPGLFTESGHFFVLTGLTDDGKVIINDPYSYERSSQTWDPETIVQEAIIFYAFANAQD